MMPNVLLIALISLGAMVALFAMPQVSEASSHTNATSTQMRKAKVDAVCMQTAVGVREDAIQSAWTTFSSSTLAALSVRKSALNAAWGLTDLKAQKTSIIKAWKDWKKSSKDAHMTLKKDRKAAWETFKKTAKNTCKITTPGDESLSTDGAGSISL